MNEPPENHLPRLSHTARRHAQLGGSVGTTHIPFGGQRGECFSLFAAMNLGFDPARTNVRGRRAVRSRLLLLAHPCTGSIKTGESAMVSPYHARAVPFKHRNFMGFA